MKNNNKNIELICKEDSYDIIGVAFKVFNELGYGHQERYYENAMCQSFDTLGRKYQRQVKCDLMFENKKVGTYYLDILYKNKIIIEIKVGKRFYKNAFKQIISYLKANNKQLGILIIFTSQGVRFIRIVNFNYISIKETEIKFGNTRKLLKY